MKDSDFYIVDKAIQSLKKQKAMEEEYIKMREWIIDRIEQESNQEKLQIFNEALKNLISAEKELKNIQKEFEQNMKVDGLEVHYNTAKAIVESFSELC